MSRDDSKITPTDSSSSDTLKYHKNKQKMYTLLTQKFGNTIPEEVQRELLKLAANQSTTSPLIKQVLQEIKDTPPPSPVCQTR